MKQKTEQRQATYSLILFLIFRQQTLQKWSWTMDSPWTECSVTHPKLCWWEWVVHFDKILMVPTEFNGLTDRNWQPLVSLQQDLCVLHLP